MNVELIGMAVSLVMVVVFLILIASFLRLKYVMFIKEDKFEFNDDNDSDM